MVKRVRVLSMMDAIMHSYKQDIPSCIIISITCANESIPNFYKPNSMHKGEVKVKGIFDMHFEDIDHYIEGYREPRACDFVGLKDFIDKYKEEVEEIIVHCHAGVSRSSGCASAICRYLGIDDMFIWGSEDYVPNRLVNKFAREELGVIIGEEELQELYDLNDRIHMNLVAKNEDVFKNMFI